MSTFLRVTLPLSGVGFMNQASRAVIATIAPALALEFGLSASELGMLAAIFFASYASAQLPIGVALDRYGPARVQVVLASIAALGFGLCGLASNTLMLGIGRAISGFGIAAALMALMKANAQWYPRQQQAAMAGLAVFIGATGGLFATLPAQALLPLIGWRGMFLLIAAISCVVAVWIRLSVPTAPPGAAPPVKRKLGQEIAEIGPILRNHHFTRMVPAIALVSALNFTYQGLWAGPWLRDVGLLDDTARAGILFTYALGMMAGGLLGGQASSFAQARGHDAMLVPFICMGGMAVAQLALLLQPTNPTVLALLWFLFAFCGATGPVGYAAVSQTFPPALAGRAVTAINAIMLLLVFILQNLIGVVLDLWPRTASGGWQADGYSWALGLTLAGQVATTAWLVLAPAMRRKPA